MLYILIVLYSSIVFAIHGGELFQNINRQIRNIICAIPFGIICLLSFNPYIGIVSFILAYGGVSLGFDIIPSYIGLAIKGFITCPFGGFVALPLAYFIGSKTKYLNVLSEYLSGTFYGIILSLILYLN